MNKKTVVTVIQNVAKAHSEAGEELEAAAVDEVATLVKAMPDETTVVSKIYTPIHKGSPIAYPLWKCGFCGFEERYKPGAYCKFCGRKVEP